MKGKSKIYPDEELSCGLAQELETLAEGEGGGEKEKKKKEYSKPLKKITSK